MNECLCSSTITPFLHTTTMYQQTDLFDAALYCEEEHLDNNDGEIINTNCFIEQQQIQQQQPFSELFEHSVFLSVDDDDDCKEELSSFLHKEHVNELYPVLELNPSLAISRDEAVEWMLKVVGYYSFSALTAVLAVNYLDRFLCTFQFQKEKPWMSQLAAVACLSLAAKVEETEVPLLLDLQVEESKYLFESKTIQRMELLVLSTLEWRMNPVTPLSFLDYIARRLAFKSHLCCKEFIRRCECLLLSVVTDCRFMCLLPSALATATMLYVISSVDPCIGVEYQDQLISILGINKDKVEECCVLIQEVATSVEFQSGNKRKFGSLPYSPKGVVDISFSSTDDDSSNDSWWPLDSVAASVSSSPEPLSKKIKCHNPDNGIF